MSAKELFCRFIDEAPNRGNLGVIDDVFSEDVRYYLPFSSDPLVGRDAVRGVVEGFRWAFPDLTVSVEELVEEGDKLAARVTASGTNRGELMGNPPTGRTAIWSVVHVSRLDRGRIVEDRITFDVLGFLQQLGLPPTT